MRLGRVAAWSAPVLALTTLFLWAQSSDQINSSPPDTTSYSRPLVSEELGPVRTAPLAPVIPGVASPTVVDTVVNNTDPNLKTTDTFGDQECSIAVNPSNTSQITISAFSGGWGTNAPVWYSTDGGVTWTKEFSVPVPPGLSGTGGCPCDQTYDYNRSNLLFGSILTFFDVVSGSTSNPGLSSAWAWLLSSGNAQKTEKAGTNPDQPWMLVNRDPVTAAQDNVYTAYDDFNTNPVTMRIAVSKGASPPNFTVDQSSGASLGPINPGHRLAVDPRNGWVYSLFQRNIAGGAGGSKNINYMLNRSTDGGSTWTLNSSATGIIVANGDSTQPTPKFGTVNALLGGVLHAAVDPNSGAIYYVYGKRDAVTGNNRLAIRKLTLDLSNNVVIGSESFVTGQVQAAIPQVAVANNGIVGVFYYTFDGFSMSGIPMFTAHLALSTDGGATFGDQVLESFLSSATDDNLNSRQRVLGDYQQLKVVSRTFYGVFTGNGVPFGRTISNHDPIFYTQDVDRPPVANAGSNQTVSADANCQAVVTLDGTGSSDPDGDTLTYLWTGPFVVPASGMATGPTPTVTLPKGMNTITLKVTDPYGKSSTTQVTITVNDTTPPSVTNISASPNSLWPPNHKFVPVTINYNAADNCNLVNCVLTVSSNEPPTDGPEWQVVDAHHVLLRSERLGDGNGRIYTIAITCTDGSGNPTVKTVTVTVPHDQGQ